MNSPPLSWSYKFFTISAILALIVAIFNIAEIPSSASSKGKKGLIGNGTSAITQISRETIFGITSGGNLITFNSDNPSTILTNVAVSGLQGGEILFGLDFRPATGLLYAVGSTSQVYTINPVTGAATAVGAPFTPVLSGTSFGVDFNPVPDRIRVVSNTGVGTASNFRLNPITGALAGTDTALSYPASGDTGSGFTPNIVGAAYTNNFVGATATTLYDIDSNLDTLVMQGGVNGAPSPNLGVLTTVGSLGVLTTDTVAFDISDFSRTAYASMLLTGGTSSNLYTINLTTGAATRVGTTAIGGASPVTVTSMSVGFNGETLMGLTQSNKLITFNSASPATITRTVQITGLLNGDTLVGLDYRPANGNLMAVGTNGSSTHIYTINPLSGAATSNATATVNIAGTDFGVDFNPIPDRIRIVGNTGQSYRVTPGSLTVPAGTVTTDTSLTYATGSIGPTGIINVTGVAYTNNVAGATSTTLYDINASSGPSGALLTVQGMVGATGGTVGAGSPNGGVLTNVGALGGTGSLVTTNFVGFDISGATGAAFASLNLPNFLNSNLYTINLGTGAATLVGGIGGNEILTDLVVVNTVETVFAVNVNNQLLSFASTAPAVLLSGPITITGLQSGETIRGIDFRPATGGLYGLGSTGRLYIINPTTAAA